MPEIMKFTFHLFNRAEQFSNSVRVFSVIAALTLTRFDYLAGSADSFTMFVSKYL